MRLKLALLLSFLCLAACATGQRHPSSVVAPKQFGKGTRITLMQPIPFINSGKKKQSVSVKSRKNFTTQDGTYNCQLSVQVPEDETYFFTDGTSFEYKETSSKKPCHIFQQKKGAPVKMECFNVATQEPKTSLSIDEVRMAFPPDVLVIE